MLVARRVQLLGRQPVNIVSFYSPEVTSCDATECDGVGCDVGARNVWRQYLSQILNGKSDLRPSTSNKLAR